MYVLTKRDLCRAVVSFGHSARSKRLEEENVEWPRTDEGAMQGSVMALGALESLRWPH
jgi:hypothetical protein